ncbi:polysaccharide lyase family protein [Microlunatus elymi]|nr:polysaccharide lyase family protein [Microlunatus elymi]
MIISRRTFQLSAAAAAGTALAAGRLNLAEATPTGGRRTGKTPTATETDTEITVDNGRIRAVISKEFEGRLISLKLGEQELIAEGGRGRFDQNVNILEPKIEIEQAPVSYRVDRADGQVMITVTLPPSTDAPYRRDRSYIFAADEPGFHLAPRFAHSAEHPAVSVEQHRFVWWVDPAIFTHASLEDDDFGKPWRRAAAQLPTPDELAAGPMVMDATYDLAGLGSGYARRCYTKYDWAISMRDHVVHGLYGRVDDHYIGAFAVLANRESFNGGPDRQDLTLHQTDAGPVLLLEPHATHYGAPFVNADGDWAKTYGPYFVYLGTADSPDQLRRDALQYADPKRHAELYDRSGLVGWVPTSQRATVRGRLNVRGATTRGAMVILSDDETAPQDTAAGFQYWTEVEADGSFRLDAVRPGSYRLTARRPGLWGEYVRDHVRIDGPTKINIDWRPEKNGRLLWQIGSPDGTSAEFAGAQQARRYDSMVDYSDRFRDGLDYRIGRNRSQDWYFTQKQQVDGQNVAPWRIHFDLDRQPRADDVFTLTISLAGWSLDSAVPNPGLPSNLTLSCNDGAPIVWDFGPDAPRGAIYRSANRARGFVRRFRLDPASLRRGANTLTLTVNQGIDNVVTQATYDALRLELA